MGRSNRSFKSAKGGSVRGRNGGAVDLGSLLKGISFKEEKKEGLGLGVEEPPY